MASAALKSAMSALASTPLEAPALAPSKLGTQAHWNSTYAREIRSFAECGDEGEVWFGEDAAEEMVEWALENIQDKAVKTLDGAFPFRTKVMDLLGDQTDVLIRRMDVDSGIGKRSAAVCDATSWLFESDRNRLFACFYYVVRINRTFKGQHWHHILYV